ncbi:protein TolR [soil metagenome]
MRRHSAHYRLGTVSEINVTPLLDLAFVLLIIFMITASFLAESADLIIPTSKAARDAVDPSKVFTLAIDRGGAIELNGSPMAADDLPAGILALRRDHPDLAVLIRAHSALPIQDLVATMDTLKNTGVAKVGLVTKPDAE